MKENMHSIDVRIHHRICDAQKHLVQGKGDSMKEYINQVTSIELVLRVIKRFQVSFQGNLIHVGFQQRNSDEGKDAFYRCEKSSQNL